jgi:putative peptidoglycan lipid II flippase
MVAWALLWYTVGLVGHSLVEILSRAFYAMHDTRTPVLIGVAAMSLNVVFSLTFPGGFERLGWFPHGGLALANSLATALETAGLLFLMRRRLNGIAGEHILKGIIQSAGATLVMSASLILWVNRMAMVPAWIVGAGGVIIGGLVYGLSVLGLHVPEALSLWHMVQQRVGKRLA